MDGNWIYSDERLALRGECLAILLRAFGRELNENSLPLNSPSSIYGCAHDWVSQGNPTTTGIISYYETYYKG